MSRHGPGNAFRQNVPSVLSGADSNPGACLLIRRLPPRPMQLVTDLEQRFSRAQIRQMCTAAGLVDLRFSPRAPFWCVVGFKA